MRRSRVLAARDEPCPRARHRVSWMHDQVRVLPPGLSGATASASFGEATGSAAGGRFGDRLAHTGTAMAMKASGLSILAGTALVAAVAWGSVGDGRVPFDRLPQPAQERVRDVVDHAVFERTVRDVTFRSRESRVPLFPGPSGCRRGRGPGAGGGELPGPTATRRHLLGRRHARRQGNRRGRVRRPPQARRACPGDIRHQMAPDHPCAHRPGPRFRAPPGADGHAYATSDVTGYLRVDNRFLDALARLVGPIVVGAVDRKVARTAGIAAKVSERAYDDPAGFLEALRKLPDLDQTHLAAVAARLGNTDGSRPDTSSH